MSETQQLHTEAMNTANAAYAAQQAGDNIKYLELTKVAFEIVVK